MEKYLQTDFWIGFMSAMFASFLSFVTPVWPFILVAIVLTVMDLFSGIKAAKTRGESIHSRGLRRSVEKITLYTIAILAAEQMRTTFFPAINLTYGVSFGIAIAEFQSLVENVETVTGVNVWSRIKAMIPGLQKLLTKTKDPENPESEK